MASKVEIANMALMQLGVEPITAFSDNTSYARKINKIWDYAVDAVLSAGAWSTVTYRQALAATVDEPTYEYAYQYQLPTNPEFLVLLSVSDGQTPVREYVIEGDKLLTDVSPIYIKYVGRQTDTTLYGPNLTKALVAYIMFMLAKSVTGSISEAGFYEKRYDKVLMEALAADGVPGLPDIFTSTVFTEDIR